MTIHKVTENKKAYLDLLLLADEQEDMIDLYLERGELFVLDDGGVIGECVVTKEGDGVCELKSLAVAPKHQRQGYGKKLVDFAFGYYADCRVMLVGTGDVPSSLGFYAACGFTPSHRVKNFFTDNYDHLMFEDGVQLVDMVYLKREKSADIRCCYGKIQLEENIMKKMIGCCGLDCEKCDAYLATVHNDDALRAKTAKLWSELNKAEILPEMINCTGCRVDGVKTYFCSNMCEIRKCAESKSLATCGECSALAGCEIVGEIHKHSEDALKNLK